MKIDHLFKAIEIDELDHRRFSKHLAQAWRQVRFANPPAGYHGSDQIGAALLTRDNFAWKSSGWFDSNGITFPLNLVPRKHAELREHLEWMLDCRRNADVVQYIWLAVTKALPTKLEARKYGPRRTKISTLALDLEDLLTHIPELAEPLLSGRLAEVRTWFIDHSEDPRAEKAAPAAWLMVVVWALFDLQVIAYRLFHAEWNPLDAGMESPESMTGESLEKLAKELLQFARGCDEAFRSGRQIDDLPSDLHAFIADHKLIEHAERHAAALGIDAASIRDGGFDRRALERYLRYLRHWFERILAFCAQEGRTPGQDFVAYANHAAGKSKARYAASRDRAGVGGGTAPLHRRVASLRFSVPALTALLYAIDHVFDELNKLELGYEGSDGKRFRSPIFGKRELGRVRRHLYAIYRDLFVRPVNHGDTTLGEAEHQRYLTEARAMVAKGGEDPGLEPIPTSALQPAQPLYGGTPARPQLARPQPARHPLTGAKEKIPAGRNTKGPSEWEARRIHSDRTDEVEAIRTVVDNPEVHHEFAAEAEQLDEDFGSSMSRRLSSTW